MLLKIKSLKKVRSRLKTSNKQFSLVTNLFSLPSFLSMLLLLQYFSYSDPMPLPKRAEKKANHHFKVNFFHDPNGKWFSMLNLRVTLQSPDILDVEDVSSSSSLIKDFDQLDEEEENDENFTNIVIQPWLDVQALPVVTAATTSQPDLQSQLIALTASNSFTERTTTKLFSTPSSSKEVVYLDNDQVLGLDEVRRLVTIHIPHKLRHSGHKHTSTSPTSTPTPPTTQADQQTSDDPFVYLLNVNMEDKDYYHAQNFTSLAPTAVGQEETAEYNETSSKSFPDLETILMGSPANGFNKTDLINQNMFGNTASIFGNASFSTLEPENITLSPEQEYQLMAKEILHVDELNRDLEEMRTLLTNLSHLEEKERFYGSAHRDYGGSFLLPLLKASKYDNNSAPMMFTDVPVNVKVSLNIIHLTNFDSQQMEYTVDLELNMAWFDVRLANNYTKPIRVRESYILDQIWKPDPYFNSKYSYFHTVSFPNFRMRIMPDGFVLYTLRVTLLPDCQMTFCRHPHDSQKCFLVLSSVAYSKSVIQFHWHSNKPVIFSSKVSLPELRIKRLVADTCSVEGKLISSSCLRLAFFMERDGARYIVEKYIPSTLAMMFAWVAPYVP